jgi:hypothetical protein
VRSGVDDPRLLSLAARHAERIYLRESDESIGDDEAGPEDHDVAAIAIVPQRLLFRAPARAAIDEEVWDSPAGLVQSPQMWSLVHGRGGMIPLTRAPQSGAPDQSAATR